MTPLGMTPFERFEVDRLLGRGGFGSVFVARDRVDRHRVALKMVTSPADRGSERMKREFRIMAGLCHPNILRPHDLYADTTSAYYTMPVVNGVDILTWLGVTPWLEPEPNVGVRAAAADETTQEECSVAVSESESSPLDGSVEPKLDASPGATKAGPRWSPCTDPARVVGPLAQLVDALDYLHSRGIHHRDVKPGNILVTPTGHVHLIDFGMASGHRARSGFPGRSVGFVGTPAYAAPEQFTSASSPQSDWFAVGVLLYQAFAGRLPFEGSRSIRLVSSSSTAAAPLGPLAPQLPQRWVETIMALLAPSVADRAGGRELRALLGLDHVGPATTDDPDGRRLVSAVSRAASRGEPLVACVSGSTVLRRRAVDTLLRTLPESAIVVRGRCDEYEHGVARGTDTLTEALVLCAPDGLPRASGLAEALRQVVGNEPVVLVLDDLEAIDAAGAASIIDALTAVAALERALVTTVITFDASAEVRPHAQAVLEHCRRLASPGSVWLKLGKNWRAETPAAYASAF